MKQDISFIPNLLLLLLIMMMMIVIIMLHTKAPVSSALYGPTIVSFAEYGIPANCPPSSFSSTSLRLVFIETPQR